MWAYDDYLSAVVDHFWDYAEHEFGDRPQLFERSDRSPNRPPVFHQHHTSSPLTG